MKVYWTILAKNKSGSTQWIYNFLIQGIDIWESKAALMKQKPLYTVFYGFTKYKLSDLLENLNLEITG